MTESQISAFGIVLLFGLGGTMIVVTGLLVSAFLRPKRPNEEKLSPYECGEEAVGSAWNQFNVRYYIIALIFILFEVEVVFLFPWAVVFGQRVLIEASKGLWGWFALLEMIVFVGILIIGLAYVWRKGFLEWVKPLAQKTDYKSKIPAQAYDHLREKK
ncbi:MAG: NADH-quinone oxidoreductase subunit A [Bacteroidia bacterium]|nr:NADH-quinone oxidoreductase subunit A [Bacteroidia bacterium]